MLFTLSRTQCNKFHIVCPTFLTPVHLYWDVLGLVLFTARCPPVANCQGQGLPTNFDWKTMNSVNSNWTWRQAVWSQNASHSQGGNLNLWITVENCWMKSSKVSKKMLKKQGNFKGKTRPHSGPKGQFPQILDDNRRMQTVLTTTAFLQTWCEARKFSISGPVMPTECFCGGVFCGGVSPVPWTLCKACMNCPVPCAQQPLGSKTESDYDVQANSSHLKTSSIACARERLRYVLNRYVNKTWW